MIPASDPLKLKPLAVKGLPGVIDVPEEGLSIGRDPKNDLELSGDEHPYISSFHTRIGIQDGAWVIEDLDSKNGTLVNGRKVTRHELSPGDVIQLGREVGIRFAVIGDDASATQTLNLGTELQQAVPSPDLGATTIMRLKHVLGLPSEEEKAAGKRNWAPSVGTYVLFAVVVVVLGWGFWALREEGRARDELAKEQRKTIDSLRETQRESAEEIQQSQRELAAAYEKERLEVEEERDRLQEQIDALNVEDASAAEELETLRGQLGETNEKLEQFKPIDLAAIERSKREILERVLKSIVYIEKRVAFKEVGGERYLHNTEVGGSLLRRRSDTSDKPTEDLLTEGRDSGSGFVISSDGFIATNAHVISLPDMGPGIRVEEVLLEPIALLSVVFTGTAEPLPADLVAQADAGNQDFAILKIQPFETMPFLTNFTTKVELPSEGTPVRLFGFPLGTQLIQDRDRLTASVFMGSVSRKEARGYIQVQSAVYPGNSGGPVIDETGRVIGIVTAVQTLPGGQIASDVGFVLPIRDLSIIWPRPTL